MNDIQATINPALKKWVKCDRCSNIMYIDDLLENLKVCEQCSHHFTLTARQRIEQVIDENTFEELYDGIHTANPIQFMGYEEKLEKAKEVSGEKEAVITGMGDIDGIKVAIGVMDSFFIMGSMGMVVGEKLTLLIEYATQNRLPLIIFTTSGGARMQEGIFSLMQMAKISSAVAKHDEAGLLYITVLTHPTTGGVTASFAMQGDLILSEPNALIGFAGKRVIESIIKEKVKKTFQRAEFLLERGFIDCIVQRKDLKNLLSDLLYMHEEE